MPLNFRKLFAFIVFFIGAPAVAEVRSEFVEYKDGGETFQGEVFYDNEWKEPRPGVLFLHQWMGPTEHERQAATRIVQMGYAAFVADSYGKSKRPKNRDEAKAFASGLKKDLKIYRARQLAAIKTFSKTKKADPKRIVIAGYCMGGTGALEAARGGLPIIAAVSFHGNLNTPEPEKTTAIRIPLLVLHGAIDPVVPQKEVEDFMNEMKAAKADYQLTAYSGAVHSFTEKTAGQDIALGAAYNELADKRSWRAFSDFLQEVLSTASPSVK